MVNRQRARQARVSERAQRAHIVTQGLRRGPWWRLEVLVEVNGVGVLDRMRCGLGRRGPMVLAKGSYDPKVTNVWFEKLTLNQIGRIFSKGEKLYFIQIIR